MQKLHDLVPLAGAKGLYQAPGEVVAVFDGDTMMDAKFYRVDHIENRVKLLVPSTYGTPRALVFTDAGEGRRQADRIVSGVITDVAITTLRADRLVA